MFDLMLTQLLWVGARILVKRKTHQYQIYERSSSSCFLTVVFVVVVSCHPVEAIKCLCKPCVCMNILSHQINKPIGSIMISESVISLAKITVNLLEVPLLIYVSHMILCHHGKIVIYDFLILRSSKI